MSKAKKPQASSRGRRPQSRGPSAVEKAAAVNSALLMKSRILKLQGQVSTLQTTQDELIRRLIEAKVLEAPKVI